MRYKELADRTGTSIDDVREAMAGAERAYFKDGWFVAVRTSGAYGNPADREAHANGVGRTKQEAVKDALFNFGYWR